MPRMFGYTRVINPTKRSFPDESSELTYDEQIEYDDLISRKHLKRYDPRTQQKPLSVKERKEFDKLQMKVLATETPKVDVTEYPFPPGMIYQIPVGVAKILVRKWGALGIRKMRDDEQPEVEGKLVVRMSAEQMWQQQLANADDRIIYEDYKDGQRLAKVAERE